VDSLGPGGLGVSGIHETLSSLYEGKVHTLLVEEGYSREGAHCPHCGFMGLNAGACPVCREKLTPVPDIVNEAVAKAVDQGCEIVQVNPGSGLEKVDRIGALLRYKAARRVA